MIFFIRAADTNDIPALAHIQIAGWRHSYKNIIEQNWLDALDENAQQEKWREWFDAEDFKTEIASTTEGVAAGFVSFGKLKTPPPGSSPIRPLYSAEIYALYILPEFHRQGLGKQLMRAAAERLQMMKHKSLCLWTVEKNAQAIAFYTALGGARCGKKEIEIGPNRVREACFGWRNFQKIMT